MDDDGSISVYWQYYTWGLIYNFFFFLEYTLKVWLTCEFETGYNCRIVDHVILDCQSRFTMYIYRCLCHVDLSSCYIGIIRSQYPIRYRLILKLINSANCIISYTLSICIITMTSKRVQVYYRWPTCVLTSIQNSICHIYVSSPEANMHLLYKSYIYIYPYAWNDWYLVVLLSLGVTWLRMKNIISSPQLKIKKNSLLRREKNFSFPCLKKKRLPGSLAERFLGNKMYLYKYHIFVIMKLHDYTEIFPRWWIILNIIRAPPLACFFKNIKGFI